MHPQTFNPYAYVGNSVIARTDPTGQCYPPAEFLRKIPGEDINCKNLDAAVLIFKHPNSNFIEKGAAFAYMTAWAVAHSALAVGILGSGVGAVTELATAGSLYLMAHPVAAATVSIATTAVTAASNAVIIAAAASGDPQAQQNAIVAQQMADADGPMPLGDIAGGGYVVEQTVAHEIEECIDNVDEAVKLADEALDIANAASHGSTPEEIAILGPEAGGGSLDIDPQRFGEIVARTGGEGGRCDECALSLAKDVFGQNAEIHVAIGRRGTNLYLGMTEVAQPGTPNGVPYHVYVEYNGIAYDAFTGSEGLSANWYRTLLKSGGMVGEPQRYYGSLDVGELKNFIRDVMREIR